MEKAHIDFETRSRTDLRKSGVYRYAEDATTGVWGFAWRIDNGTVRQWRPGYPDPIELLNHIAAGKMVAAHNAAFERVVWNYVLRRLVPHWPLLTIQQQDCTMSRAAAVSHPQDLATLCKALATGQQKDSIGHALMLKMARPRKFNPDGSIQWWDEPDNVERCMQYCEQDIRTECDVDEKLPPLTDYERRVWELDQTINDRGICIDLVAVEKCVTLVELAKKSADSEMRRLTERSVPKCTNDTKIIEWIQSRGIECDTVKKSEQDDLMFIADLRGDKTVREVIELRADSKKTSTAKYLAMMQCVCSDGRVRGLLNYHGAGPGRWAGRLVQPQNFPRVDHEKEGHIFEWLADLLNSERSPQEVFDCMVAVHGESGDTAPLRLLSRLLRAMIKAAPGNKLVGGDFSNIEGRVNAWFAGEQWKLDAFKAYDEGKGPDLYNVTASRITGKKIEEVSKSERQAVGKTPELACGYQGGVGAFITMGVTYNVNPYDISGPVQLITSAQQWDSTAAQYSSAKDKFGLFEREWTAIKVIIDNWRTANPRIVQSWWDLQDAAIEAVACPGNAIKVLDGKITYYSDGRCLWCVLPSGRMICYAAPQVEQEYVEYIDKNTGEKKERLRRKVTFYGFKEGQWRKLSLYGGLQCENIVQGTARCVMVDRMFAAEDRGYPLILTVHDELLAEVSGSRLDLNEKDFENIMSVVPSFVPGLPLAAKAWEDTRYVK